MGIEIEESIYRQLVEAVGVGCLSPLDKPSSSDAFSTGRMGGHLARIEDQSNPIELQQFAKAIREVEISLFDYRNARQIAEAAVPDSTMFWTVGPFVWDLSKDDDRFLTWVSSGNPNEVNVSDLVGGLPADLCFRLPCPQQITENHPSVLLARNIAQIVIAKSGFFPDVIA